MMRIETGSEITAMYLNDRLYNPTMKSSLLVAYKDEVAGTNGEKNVEMTPRIGKEIRFPSS
jgi:hypothetical protein